MQVESYASIDMLSKLQIWKQEYVHDKYTVVWPNNYTLCLSDYPTAPNGFYSHDINCTYFEVQPWKSNYGKAIEFEELPEECQKVVLGELQIQKE